jgi:cytochrome c556
MKFFATFMILFIGYVQGFDQIPSDNTASMEIEQAIENTAVDAIIDSVTPTSLDLINLKQQDRCLSSTCNVCHKKYLY